MINKLIRNYPVLKACKADISRAFELLKSAFENKGIMLACGNGGSAADAEHMVGEMMKTFNLGRPLPEKLKRKQYPASCRKRISTSHPTNKAGQCPWDGPY